MKYERHYIQYNDLVFDYYDMISEDDDTTKYKYDSASYTFRNGDYVAHKQRGMLADAGNVSLTITLEMKKIPCDMRPYYTDFAISQLNEQGKLWAVQNNRIIWAYAFVDEINIIARPPKNTFQVDVDFVIPEGVWHKADYQKTFLVPYSSCDFLDCYGYHDIQPCKETNCCNCDTNEREENCDCCECLEKDMALCYHMDEMQDFYSCHNDYRIVYSCSYADKFFGDVYSEEHMGQKFCSCTNVIAGRLYSDTNLPTHGVTITINGHAKNPIIEINGNRNLIHGNYPDGLVIYPDGSVYSHPGCMQCLKSVVLQDDDDNDIDLWVIPKGMEYGWTIYPGYNRIVIDTGVCCGTVCAYIEVDSLT